MPMDYAALRAELNGSHPVTGPYNADARIAAIQINARNITRVRRTMSGSRLWAMTDPAEFFALPNAKKANWLNFCLIPEHSPKVGGLTSAFVKSTFPGASKTLDNLRGARDENISRAKLLDFGRVRAGDVAEARR